MLKRQNLCGLFQHNSKGFSLIEVLIALALLGIIGVAFLSGLATASKALFIADERTTAESLARSQMEYVKNCSYEYGASPSYEQVDVESLTHPGYFISVDAPPIDPDTGAALANPGDDEGIQKITVTIEHPDGDEVITLDGYKVNR